MKQQTAQAINKLKLHLRGLRDSANPLNSEILSAAVSRCESLAAAVWGMQTPREFDELADKLRTIFYRVSHIDGFKVYYTDSAQTWAEVCGQDARKVAAEN